MLKEKAHFELINGLIRLLELSGEQTEEEIYGAPVKLLTWDRRAEILQEMLNAAPETTKPESHPETKLISCLNEILKAYKDHKTCGIYTKNYVYFIRRLLVIRKEMSSKKKKEYAISYPRQYKGEENLFLDLDPDSKYEYMFRNLREFNSTNIAPHLLEVYKYDRILKDAKEATGMNLRLIVTKGVHQPTDIIGEEEEYADKKIRGVIQILPYVILEKI